jgi:hypothetical protein
VLLLARGGGGGVAPWELHPGEGVLLPGSGVLLPGIGMWLPGSRVLLWKWESISVGVEMLFSGSG